MIRARRGGLVLLATLAPLGACSDPTPGAGPNGAPCTIGYVGDPAQPAAITLRALRADGTDVALAPNDDLALVEPPQGGRVAFVGVRANNVDGCAVQIVGALRDPATRQVRLDGRTVNLRREPDGWGATGGGATSNLGNAVELGDYSNVPLCPNQWASTNVYDVPFELDVVITDRAGKTASQTITVVPRCSEPAGAGATCRCICRKGYILGQACADDGGAP